MPLPSLSLAVVGADFPNEEGPSRRSAIAMCRPGHVIELRPEPTNPADPRAVAVYSSRGVKIGYLTAERCGRIGKLVKQGQDVRAVFQRPAAYGCVIRVSFDGKTPVLPKEKPPEEHLYDDLPPWVDESYPDDVYPD